MSTATYDRIRKLLNLADLDDHETTDDARLNEAATARRMAERLMEAAGIGEADLAEDGDVDPLASFGESGETLKTRGWMGILAVAVARVVGCFTFSSVSYGLRNKREARIRWVGTAQQRETAQQLYEWMLEQIERLAKGAQATARESGNARAWLGAYRRGMANAIARQAERLVTVRASAAPDAGPGLVRVRAIDAAIEQFKKQRGIRGYRTVSYRTSAGGAYEAGKNDGNSVRLQRDVGGGDRLRLASGAPRLGSGL